MQALILPAPFNAHQPRLDRRGVTATPDATFQIDSSLMLAC